jgi:hypothetical protein
LGDYKLSILRRLTNRTSYVTNGEVFQSRRAFDVGKIAGSEISLWVELTKSCEDNSLFDLVIRVKNEGGKPVSNLALTCKNNPGVKIFNKGEIFATPSNKAGIKKLLPKQVVSYKSAVSIREIIANNFITISLNSALQDMYIKVSVDFISSKTELSA